MARALSVHAVSAIVDPPASPPVELELHAAFNAESAIGIGAPASPKVSINEMSNTPLGPAIWVLSPGRSGAPLAMCGKRPLGEG
jgi:hypothetical protein